MSAADFTPGPWKATKYVGHEDSWFVRGPQGERICGRGAGRVAEANARLIAAAPELYAALEHILDGTLSLPRFAEEEGRAALTKARGEQVAA